MRPANTPLTSRNRRRKGLTILEALISLTIFGLAMTAVTRQLIESATLSLKSSRLLEYARNGRNLLGTIGGDVRSAQTIILYPSFTDRSTTQASGAYGSYLVLHEVNTAGTVTRTVGYYSVQNGSSGTFSLYRHDSADGMLTPGNLHDTTTSGSHRKIVSIFRLPATPTGIRVFRNWQGRGVSVRGQFGTASGQATTELNLLQATFATRS